MATERDEAERAAWREQIAALDATQFVLVDESSANATLTPRSARAPHNARASDRAPRNYRHNTTLVAALTPAGLQVPMTMAGALDGDAFAAYVAHFLVPILQPSQVVILDNLNVHTRADIRALIEQSFGKVKTALRRAQARTHEALGQIPPAQVYQPSGRPYPERPVVLDYLAAAAVRRVRHNGELYWRTHYIYLSAALAGQPVGLTAAADGQWQVVFGPLVLGTLDEGQGKLLVPRTAGRARPSAPPAVA